MPHAGSYKGGDGRQKVMDQNDIGKRRYKTTRPKTPSKPANLGGSKTKKMGGY